LLEGDILNSLNYLNIAILVILALFSIKGFLILKDRNIGMISMAFIMFLASRIIISLPYQLFIIDDTHLYFSAILNISFITIGVVLILFAFYNNYKYNNILIKKMNLAIFITSTISIGLVVAFWLNLDRWWWGMASIYDFVFYFSFTVTIFPLIFLLFVLIKFYLKSRNSNTMFIIAGFSFLFLEYTLPGILLTFYSVGYLFGDYIYSLLTLELISFLANISFLIVLVKTRVRK
jgi:hypothetical protein